MSHNGDPMTPWLHVRHVLLMQATCDCAWLLTMPIVATMRGHRSLPLLDRSHYDPLEPCAPGEFRVLKAWVVCSCCCFVGSVATATVVLQHSSKFVATIAVTARLKFVWQGRVYIRCRGEGVGGGRTTSILAVRVWLFGSSGPSHLCGWDSPAPMWAGLYG